MDPISMADLAADYDLGHISPRLKGLTAQVNAANISDVKYLANCLNAMDCSWAGAAPCM